MLIGPAHVSLAAANHFWGDHLMCFVCTGYTSSGDCRFALSQVSTVSQGRCIKGPSFIISILRYKRWSFEASLECARRPMRPIAFNQMKHLSPGCAGSIPGRHVTHCRCDRSPKRNH